MARTSTSDAIHVLTARKLEKPATLIATSPGGWTAPYVPMPTDTRAPIVMAIKTTVCGLSFWSGAWAVFISGSSSDSACLTGHVVGLAGLEVEGRCGRLGSVRVRNAHLASVRKDDPADRG